MNAIQQQDSDTSLDGLIDLEHYPIHRLTEARGRELMRQCREQLAQDGCVVLEGFVPQEALTRLEQETERLSPLAHYNQTVTNPYNSDGDDSLPASHPRNRFDDRTNGFVAGDRIGSDTLIRQVYTHPDFQHFIASVVGMDDIHQYADPLADLVVNVLRDGCQHPWHYDTNEFIVTMMTRKSDAGGRFEYAAGIRSPEGENFEGVEKVLDGDRSRLTAIDLKPGDLQIFFGRYSLHRVTPVRGERERHTVIFAYAKEPGFIGRPERAQRIFGRMAPIHERLLKEGMQRSDNLAD
ncbi:phytanoyl-CoA dioxygenase family protein [Cobetia sp. MMG027]|uniref:HalD/BesD family halogenase n=1 Tax=Cobetia TaxID=204286 RepID=UPI0022FE029C|nr:phytanoyl-CoA dioxygenase family protein [Cobetia sp. MMG027]MDA5564972.1 phytanoyl-CoA dioxygenase family protein [Cobetia sp. MMG027]